MLSPLSRVLACAGFLAVTGAAGPASAQFLFDPCCRPCRPACPPPPVQQCYRTIPVTEYREVQQTVQRPDYYTDYEERDVTEYRRVCETQTVQVPTVCYQTVTEHRTVQRDCGRWVSHVECRPKLAPCDYDNRPDILGALNRTAYSVRMAFTPDTVTHRTWQPNIVTQQIPVTRQVAVRGVKNVQHQVARIVPVTTRKQVAVTKMRMVCQNITLRQPVTVFRTVPVGTGYAFAAPINANTATASARPTAAESVTAGIQPTPAGNDLGERTAIAPKETSRAPSTEQPQRERAKTFTDDSEDDIKGSGEKRDQGRANERSPILPRSFSEDEVARKERPQGKWVASRKSKRPVGEWVARNKADEGAGPALEPIILAQASRPKN